MADKFHFNESLKRFEPTETHCFYCGGFGAGNDTNLFVPLFKEQDRTNLVVYRSVKYSKFHIGIPRCASCRKIHSNAALIGALVALAAAALTMTIGIMIWGIMGVFAFIPAIFIAVFGYSFVVTKMIRKKGIATESDGAKQDPTVQEFLMTGWSLTQPSA